jgi:hypothetical protein
MKGDMTITTIRPTSVPPARTRARAHGAPMRSSPHSVLTEISGPDAAATIRRAIAEKRAAEKRAADKERKRLSRARLEIGIRTHRVAVPAMAVMGLVESGFLLPNDGDKDDAVASAVAAFLLARLFGHT